MEKFRLKRNLDELVYEKLLRSIFEGNFRSGEIISIERLCEQYEISRTPVIQAIKRLYSDGIVDMTPTGKFLFPMVDDEIVHNMLDVRLRFEMLSAEQICEKISAEEYIQIFQCAEDCAKYQAEGNSYMASITDMEFHRRMVAGVGNPYWVALFQRVQNQCLSINYLNLNGESVVSPVAISHHKLMCDALRNKDKQELVKVIQEHIQFVESQIIENIRIRQQNMA